MPPPLCQFLRLMILIATMVTASHANGLIKPNVLLICVDDLRPELKSFGANYVKSPNIDKLAAQGRPFHRHYVQAHLRRVPVHSFDRKIRTFPQRSPFCPFKPYSES